jgi:hypothetical protein
MAAHRKTAKTRHKRIPAALPGAVCVLYTRCGKPNCHCTRGSLHGPYHVRRWRSGDGRHHSAYVRPVDVERVRQACARWHEQQYTDRQQMRAATRYSRMTAQALIAELQKVEQWLQERR